MNQIKYLPNGKAIYYIEGREVPKAEFDKAMPCKFKEIVNSRGNHSPYTNPLWAGGAYYSDAMSVHESQRKEASEYCRKQGVPTNFREDGSPEILDRAHRKKLARVLGGIYGMHDNNAGYGDPTPD